MRIGILTFHAAHNYGSMLQNYALQQVLINIGHQVETINLRTPMQKEMYDYFKPFSKLIDKKRIVYSILYFPWKKQLDIKYKLFEKFLCERLILSEELDSYDKLNIIAPFDAYIIGSDQCWNMTAKDFDWSYFLGFAPHDSRKLSYAISMGPHPQTVLEKCGVDLHKVKDLLSEFDGISVRDVDTQNVTNRILNNVETSVHVDPTLLLSKEEWKKISTDHPIVEGKYIFFYNPYWVKETFEQARVLSKITGLRVICSTPNLRGNIQYYDFEKKFEIGPSEFLNLVENAEYVIGRSFHLIVFCIIFKKKFIAVEGLGDSRINELLKRTSLEKCATDKGNVEEVVQRLDSIDFTIADQNLANERDNSIQWLSQHLS